VQAGSGETAAPIRDTLTESASGAASASRSVWPLARFYVLAVIVVGLLVQVHAVGQLFLNPPGSNWWLLLGLTLLSGTAVLKIPSTSVNFSISDVFTLTSAVVFGPAAGAVTVAIDCLAISYRLARSPIPPERVLFNVVAPPLAMWIAAHLFFVTTGIDPGTPHVLSLDTIAPALLLMAGAYFLLNTFAVALAVALHEHANVIAVWRAHFQNLWISFLGGAAGAGFVVFALEHGNYGMAVLGLPLLLAVILHFAYRNATGRVEDQVHHLAELNRLHLSTVESLAHAIDAKDSVTHSHIRRVQTIALVLAKRTGLKDDAQLKALEAAALLHDIGKLAVPEHILNKPGRLTPAEFERMKLHAAVGAEILAEVDFPYPVVPIVRHHHENWDGTGYPDGISGAAIPIGARILSISDCYDALTSDRPYRRALTPDAALAIIRERRGTMYDPALVDEFEEIYQTLDTAGSTTPWSQALCAAEAPRDQEPRATGAGDEHETPLDIAFPLGAALATCASADLGSTMWQYLSRLTGVRTVAIHRVTEGRDQLGVVYAAGAGAHSIRGLVIPLGERVCGWVAATSQPMLNADAALDLMGEAPHLRCALAVPLIADATVTGVIVLYSDLRDAFDQDTQRLIQSVATVLGPKVESLDHVNSQLPTLNSQAESIARER
jgi:putative nucleotidyltransferase with HDIG domain